MGIKFGVKINIDVKAMQRNMLSEIAATFETLGDEGIKFMDNKISDWKNKTKFRKEVSVKAGKWLFSILHSSGTPEGQIFNYVTWGTQGPYQIKPKQASMLSFTVPNTPKTAAPGKMKMASAGGPKMHVFAKEVTHPGIEARRFDKELRAVYEKELVPRTRAAARRGLAKR